MASTHEMEALAASAARQSLLAYAIGMIPRYETPAHLELLAEKLEAVERGEIKRLMVFMPPRHGKSNQASEVFPAWYLGRKPDRQVMFTTYAQDLADGFGRKVRNAVADPRHVRSFPDSVLSEDSQSAKRFNTTAGGAYYAVGVGGPVTGRGADLLLLDDPLKNREEADSKLIRDKLWDWYASTAYTRLMPGGAVVLVQCMVGDTLVTMADGAQKELRDIRPGDYVATFDNWRLGASRVLNWANQGADKTYSIKTSSGTIVRANERHPFLVARNGSPEWIKVRDLRIGDRVVRVIGASGEGLNAPLMVATSQPSAKGFVAPTTTSICGQAGIDRRLSTQRHDTKRGSSAGTESTRKSSTGCLQSRADVAPSAASRRVKTSAPIGAESSALTIATTPASQEGCYATTATSQLDTSQTRQSLSEPPSTCDFTTEAVLEIVEAGVEDVFDIQVERTENFIANGLVSHNTRWHEDDLAGRLLNGPEQWEVVNLPALAEDRDELGREPGEALWPERYDEHALERIRSTIGEREFIALYQQRPAPLDGAMFRRDWIKRGKAPRAGVHVAMGVDLALSTKTSADYTAIVVMSRDEFGKLYVLDAVRERVDFPGALRLIRQMAEKWNPRQIAIEQVAYQAVVVQELLRQTTLPIKGVTPDKDKVTRAQPLALRYEQGLVSHEQLPSWFEDELLAFPQGAHDDSVDALVYAYQAVMRMTRYDDGISTAVARYEALDPEMGY